MKKKLIALVLALVSSLTLTTVLADPPELRHASSEEMAEWPSGAAGKFEVRFSQDLLSWMNDNAFFTVIGENGCVEIPIRTLMVDEVLTIFTNSIAMEEATVVYQPHNLGKIADEKGEALIPTQYKLAFVQHGEDKEHSWDPDGWDGGDYFNALVSENTEATFVIGNASASPTTRCSCNCTCGGCNCGQ